MLIDGWILSNLLCMAWTLVAAMVVAAILLELHGLRFWIPNPSLAVIDLSKLAILGLAIGGGGVVAVLSMIAGQAMLLATINLALSICAAAYVMGAALSTPGARARNRALEPHGDGMPGPDKCAPQATVLAGGDVSFDRRLEAPVVTFDKSAFGTLATTLSWLSRCPAYPVPHLRRSPGDDGESNFHSSFEAVSVPDGEACLPVEAPFRGLQVIFAEADVIVVNLESPLAEQTRFEGSRLTSEPRYAQSLRLAGVDVVNLANNHCFDAGEEGLLRTFEALEAEGVRYIGAGKDLDTVRKGVVTEVGGLRIAWLGYTQKMGRVTLDYAAATAHRFGCVPLDLDVVREDIKAAHDSTDVVIVTPHWGVEERHGVSKTIRRMGHDMIDAGASAVFGHGPHLYQGIEIYRGRPIIYSLGTLIFGNRGKAWKDNVLAKLAFQDGRPSRVEIIPVSGDVDSLLQPQPLTGDRAQAVLDHLTQLSRRFGTRIQSIGNRGIIDLGPDRA